MTREQKIHGRLERALIRGVKLAMKATDFTSTYALQKHIFYYTSSIAEHAKKLGWVGRIAGIDEDGEFTTDELKNFASQYSGTQKFIEAYSYRNDNTTFPDDIAHVQDGVSYVVAKEIVEKFHKMFPGYREAETGGIDFGEIEKRVAAVLVFPTVETVSVNGHGVGPAADGETFELVFDEPHKMQDELATSNETPADHACRQFCRDLLNGHSNDCPYSKEQK